MSPEAVNYLSIAEALLERAQRAFLAEIYEDAARGAYTTALNATGAIIFEKTGLAIKSHSGARTKLHELIHGGMPFDPKLVTFLSDGFETKQGVDYGPDIVLVDRATAEHYLYLATSFIAEARRVCA
jgi:uncharacterized protein (UPF0332 family)